MKEKILNLMIQIFNSITPKKSNKIIFRSEPDYSDNSKAFYKYLYDNHRDRYDLVWIVKSDTIFQLLRKNNIKVYKRNSIKGLIEFCRAKYIVSTHAQFANLKNHNQVYINLWHGMPLKNIGFLEKKEIVGEKYLIEEKKKFAKMDYIISTSKTTRLAMSSVFYTDIRCIHVTGQPRNDFLFLRNNKEILSKCVKGLELNKYKKIIMCIPTFRVGLGKHDGNSFLNNMLNLQQYKEDSLNDFLRENDYLLLIKFHPFEEAFFKGDNFSNIKILDSKVLSENLITLNEIMNIADLLITDYSSVYFDYLLLHRPIIFTNTDEKEYIKNRGFIFDNPDFWRPGPKVNTLDNLVLEIKKLLSSEMYYKYERETISSLVNTYTDNNSSKRIYEIIFNKD